METWLLPSAMKRGEVGSLLISWILAGGCERRGRYDRDSSKLSPQNSRRKFLQPANPIHQAPLSIFFTSSIHPPHTLQHVHRTKNISHLQRTYRLSVSLQRCRIWPCCVEKGVGFPTRLHLLRQAHGKHQLLQLSQLSRVPDNISAKYRGIYSFETCAQNLQRLAPKRIAEPEVPAPSQQVSAPRRQPASRRQPAPHKRVSAPTSRELSNQATSGEASNTPAKNNPNTAATADYTPLGSGGLQGQSSAPAAVEERDSSAPEIEPECDSDIEIFVRGMVEEANRKKDDD